MEQLRGKLMKARKATEESAIRSEQLEVARVALLAAEAEIVDSKKKLEETEENTFEMA